MPPDVPRLLCFTYVELGLLAYVDFHQGQFRVEAQLSPNSFVMNPLCHLSGGFALCTWFGSSPYAGDFVFSIGGYQSSLPNLPLTILSRRVSGYRGDWMSIYALLVKLTLQLRQKCVWEVCMLSAVFNMGLLSAYLTAHADFLMEFHPFFFVADLGLSIGVEFRSRTPLHYNSYQRTYQRRSSSPRSTIRRLGLCRLLGLRLHNTHSA